MTRQSRRRLLVLVSTASVICLSSCAVVNTDAFIAPGERIVSDEWALTPIVQAVGNSDSTSNRSLTDYRVTVEIASRGNWSLESRPVVDSVRATTNDQIRHLLLSHRSHGEPNRRVTDFGTVAIPTVTDSVKLILYGSIAGEPRIWDCSDEHALRLAHIRERAIIRSPSNASRTSISNTGGDDFGFAFRTGNKLSVVTPMQIGPSAHLGTGRWTVRLDFSLLEFFTVDTIDNIGGLIFPNPWLITAPLTTLITPDIAVERNLNRAQSAKVFVGNDLIFGNWNRDRIENIDTPDEKWIKEFESSLLVSPKVGFQVPVWAFRLRLQASYNWWWRSGRANRWLGWTFGGALVWGPQFRVKPYPPKTPSPLR